MKTKGIVRIGELDALSGKVLGGKGRSINLLKQRGFPVAEGIVIVTDEFDQFIKDNGISGRIHDILNSNSSTTEKSSELIKLIKKQSLTERMESEISTAMDGIGIHCNLIVRSSANVEDSDKYSFAGQFDTKIDVIRGDIFEAVLDIYASVYSARALAYVKTIGLQPERIKMGVIIQEFIDTDFAGISLTSNPFDDNKDNLIIEYVSGLGERLVSGETDPIHIELNKNNISMNTDPRQESIKGLNWEKLIEVAQYCIDIEKIFGVGMDIEWGVKNSKITIFQARKITTGN